mmetsp:Transcript_24432/g.31737  ORF Transcript_24432/g.31737 Transcript_24432/m.31737 type:complete len:497 (+) Transcript_24432:166-1656(+)
MEEYDQKNSEVATQTKSALLIQCAFRCYQSRVSKDRLAEAANLIIGIQGPKEITVPEDGSLNFKKISGNHTCEDPNNGNSRFTVYFVDVKCSQAAPTAHWRVYRRYSEFHDLSKKLKAKGVKVPPFPTKRFLNLDNTNPLFIETRQRELHTWMTLLIMDNHETVHENGIGVQAIPEFRTFMTESPNNPPGNLVEGKADGVQLEKQNSMENVKSGNEAEVLAEKQKKDDNAEQSTENKVKSEQTASSDKEESKASTETAAEENKALIDTSSTKPDPGNHQSKEGRDDAAENKALTDDSMANSSPEKHQSNKGIDDAAENKALADDSMKTSAPEQNQSKEGTEDAAENKPLTDDSMENSAPEQHHSKACTEDAVKSEALRDDSMKNSAPAATVEQEDTHGNNKESASTAQAKDTQGKTKETVQKEKKSFAWKMGLAILLIVVVAAAGAAIYFMSPKAEALDEPTEEMIEPVAAPESVELKPKISSLVKLASQKLKGMQ